MPHAVIEIRNLEKTYANGVRALQGIDLEIKQGEVFGLLGPNGAGKTTLIGIIAGLVRKTAGEVHVLGRELGRDDTFICSQIGLVQQELNSDFFFTVKETVDTQGGYFGIPKEKRRTEEILRKVNLWERRDTVGRQLSGGMKRRVMIAKALVHDPAILFLDEPTAGVDVELRENLWQFIRQLREGGKTIILTTHYLEEAEALADRIGIINHGKLVLVEDKKILMKQHGARLEAIYRKVVAESNTNAGL